MRFREGREPIHGDCPRPPIPVNGRPRWRNDGNRHGWRTCWALVQSCAQQFRVTEILAAAVTISEHARLVVLALEELVAQGLTFRARGAAGHAAQLRARTASVACA